MTDRGQAISGSQKGARYANCIFEVGDTVDLRALDGRFAQDWPHGYLVLERASAPAAFLAFGSVPSFSAIPDFNARPAEGECVFDEWGGGDHCGLSKLRVTGGGASMVVPTDGEARLGDLVIRHDHYMDYSGCGSPDRM